ncbi:cupin domain-containing protein [Phenylobacterium conjunctum]|jgi:quercetin dioxygenase-like cupin family protein|uniref:Cupin domain-containing protein n=1 Tax=Phenylobacterium conjunctum TaxID=1298959 RepID=A0ABW3T217_9CAUL|nr:cupin domain-containing protein [Phenylobacterium sp.]
MKFIAFAAVLSLSAGAAAAQTPVSEPVGTYARTLSGQEILAPQGPLQVTVTRTTIPAGGQLPPHKHPYARYALILEGAVKVTNLVTGTVSVVKAGEFSIESRDQWHKGEAMDGKPAVLLVIDQTPPGEANLVRMAP